MNSLWLYPEYEYGVRILVHRVFLKDVKPEELALFTQLLNDFPSYSSKKEISELAGGELDFVSYPYQDGYVLQGRLTQAKSSSLSYLFANPYSEGEKIFKDIFASGFVAEEKNLAVSKERLLASRQRKGKSSFSKACSSLSLPFSDLVYSEIDLKEIRMESLKALAEKVSHCEIQDTILIGDKKTSFTEMNPLPLSGMRKTESSHSGEDETLMILLSNAALATVKDRHVLLAALNCVSENLKQGLEKNLSLDYETHVGIIDKETSFVSFTVVKGRGEEVKAKLSLQAGDSLTANPVDSSRYLAKENLMAVRVRMDASLLVKELIEDISLGLEYQEETLSEENVKKMMESLKIRGFILE